MASKGIIIPTYEELDILAIRFALEIAPPPNHLNPFIKDAYLLGMIEAWEQVREQQDSVEE